MSYEEKYISSVPEFVEYVNQNFPTNSLFRGHAIASSRLIPGAQRPGVLPTRSRASRQNLEIKMLSQFKKEARPHLSNPPDNAEDWEWLAIAQHHGLPTRLLDWTENAATALFFAVAEPNRLRASAVWCTERPDDEIPNDVTPFEVEAIYVYDPPHVSPRITVQRSAFTVHPKDYFPEKRYRWPTPLVRVVIPADARAGIRKSLRNLGVYHSTLFPDLDGIALDIKRRHCPMKDENES